jgi:hypothetical protein
VSTPRRDEVTEDQVERVIAAVERMAAAHEEEVKLARQMQERVQRQMENGEPPAGIRRRIEALAHETPPAPPEMMRMIDALEKIATALNRDSA